MLGESPDNSTKRPRRTREEKRAALRAVMERSCVGAANRLPGSRLMKLSGLRERWDFYQAKADLNEVDGLIAIAEETGDAPGSYLADNPADVDRWLRKMDHDIAGMARSRNVVAELRRRRWPQDQFPPLKANEEPSPPPPARYVRERDEFEREALPDGFPARRPERDSGLPRRSAAETGPVERAMLSASVERSTRGKVYRKRSRKRVAIPAGPRWSLWRCGLCGEEIVRDAEPDAILTHPADGSKLTFVRRLAAEEVAVSVSL